MKEKKMRKRNQTGFAILELTHAGIHDDQLEAEQFDQRQCALIAALPLVHQDKIRKGYPISIIDLESGKEIVSFNHQNIKPSDAQIESFAKAIYEKMKKDIRDGKE